MKGSNILMGASAALIALAALPAAGASAHGDPTCSGAGGILVHGQHIVGDYVTGLGGIFGDGLEWPPAGQVGDTIGGNGGAVMPGGPGPGFHFTIDGLAPGASFCNEQAHPNGFNTPDNVPVPGNRN
ncbi:MAG TPA: hypothetical protein VFY90_10065 [Tepidiformaceae bacterium]|nr:hypothetical protein [Tepidiformaceae bacterium]